MAQGFGTLIQTALAMEENLVYNKNIGLRKTGENATQGSARKTEKRLCWPIDLEA